MVHYQYTKNEEQMWVEVKLLIGQHATWLDVAKAIVSDPFREVHLPVTLVIHINLGGMRTSTLF